MRCPIKPPDCNQKATHIILKEVSCHEHSIVCSGSLSSGSISNAVNYGKFAVEEFKALEEKYRVYLYSVDTDVQKTPVSEMDGTPETLEDIKWYIDMRNP